MAVVTKFNPSMIEKYLRTVGLKFLRDDDGDFLVQFGYSEPQGCELNFYFITSGQQKEIYVIRAFTDKKVHRDDWAKAVMYCNTWNRERRWPKAYLEVKNPATDVYGSIILEEQWDMEKGAFQEMVDHFSNIMLAAGGSFWEWVHKEKGM